MNTASLASALRQATSGLYKGLRKTMSSAATSSMTEIETIGHIARHGQIQPTELAALAHITPQSMSQILSAMETNGIIKKSPAEDDKRKVYISLTRKGLNLIDKTRYERDAWLKQSIEEKLSEEEIETLAKAIPILNKLANKK